MDAARALYIDTHAPRGAARKGLDLWIRENPNGMPLAEAMPILRAVAGLLATSHAVRQLFRTLTPAELAYDRLTRTVGLDMTRVIPGRDLRYASPEVIDDQPPNVRDDVYSFACIAYELLGGRHPYRGALASEAKASDAAFEPIAALSEAQNAALRLSEAQANSANQANAYPAFKPDAQSATGIGRQHSWRPDRPTFAPPVPEPYRTFSETFSYGRTL